MAIAVTGHITYVGDGSDANNNGGAPAPGNANYRRLDIAVGGTVIVLENFGSPTDFDALSIGSSCTLTVTP
jgi:hypothetical protein